MDSTLTWPPHDTDFIPTGSYSAGYKGPYDNDYDWPDDTQVSPFTNLSMLFGSVPVWTDSGNTDCLVLCCRGQTVHKQRHISGE